MKKSIIKIVCVIGVIAVIGVVFFLFHPHSYTLYDSKEPSCKDKGYNTYKCWCGKEYTDSVEPIGHNYIEAETEPTCTDAGKRVFTCINCKDTYEEEIQAKGHDYSEAITEPTCIDAGKRVLTCKNCHESKEEHIEALGHSYVNGICERCGEKVPEETDSKEEKEPKTTTAKQPASPTEPADVETGDDWDAGWAALGVETIPEYTTEDLLSLADTEGWGLQAE